MNNSSANNSCSEQEHITIVTCIITTSAITTGDKPLALGPALSPRQRSNIKHLGLAIFS